jgi:hypothetical protein
MRRIWVRYIDLLEHDLSTQIFDNIEKPAGVRFVVRGGHQCVEG